MQWFYQECTNPSYSDICVNSYPIIHSYYIISEISEQSALNDKYLEPKSSYILFNKMHKYFSFSYHWIRPISTRWINNIKYAPLEQNKLLYENIATVISVAIELSSLWFLKSSTQHGTFSAIFHRSKEVSLSIYKRRPFIDCFQFV